MIATIISTGDELLLGDIIDTNAAFLCRCLARENIMVTGIRSVKDNITDITQALLDVSQHADICLVTGGLGPTRDDLTALACANACNTELILHDNAMDSIVRHLAEKKYELAPEHKKQAMLPQGADVLENRWGSAPGFYIHIGRCLYFFFPGVPAEMKPMFETLAMPVIQNLPQFPHQKFAIKRYTIFGLGESRAGARLQEFSSLFPDLGLGFRLMFPCIEIKIINTTSGDIPKAAMDFVEKQLGDKIVSTQGLSLEGQVGQLLRQKGQTIAVAESCTGGLISTWLTDVPGSSAYFLLGGITYSNQAKESILHVAPATLERVGAVHKDTVLEMATGIRNAAKADWGISTTGIAGPDGGSAEKPVGTVCIGIAGPDEFAMAKQYQFNFDDRSKNKAMFAATALNLIRRKLIA